MDNQALELSGQIQQALADARACLAEDPASAAEGARMIIASHPDNSQAYRVLATALRRLGRHEEAGLAEANAIQVSARSEPLLEAAEAMRDKQVERAEHLLRSYLATDPDDPQALRMLAEIAAVCGHGHDAEHLLRKALDGAPGFIPLYINLATLLQDLERTDEAVALLDQVLTQQPDNRMVLSFRAGILAGAGRTSEALVTQERLLACAPDMAIAWTNYADMLKALGRIGEAISAYGRSLELDPTSGFAWWGLASLRTTKLDQRDIAAMQSALKVASDDFNGVQLHFALGKALGDQDRFEESFNEYAIANHIRGTLIPYDARSIEDTVRESQVVFTRKFLQQRVGQGCMAQDPIFIVGLPRSGSTLVEQILASHPLIEGCGELFEVERLARGLGQPLEMQSSWPQAIAGLSADEFRALGETYLNLIRTKRKTERPFFTDKMPFNWPYVGLIHLILPKAKIIDVRRQPMGCCFSNFSMYFSRRTNFASSLEDLCHYYRAYVRTMGHFDHVLPSRIHRVLYEDLVEDLEGEVRKLLDFIGLPFDEACLRFYENSRAIHTPSAQQVRRPVNREGLENWRNYERWLGPLKEALEPVPDVYPDRPGE